MSKRNKLPTWAMWIIFILCGSLLFAAVANVDNIKDKIDEWREDDTEESETNKKDDTDPSDTSGTTEPIEYIVSGVWVFNETIDISDCQGRSWNVNHGSGLKTLGWSCYIDPDDSSIHEHSIEFDVDSNQYFYHPVDGDEGSWNENRLDNPPIIDFGTEPQTVTKECYEWLTANANPCELDGVWLFNEELDQTNLQIDGLSLSINGRVFDNLDRSCASDINYLDLREGENNETVYDANDGGWCDQKYRTVDFGTAPQEVPASFYIWFTANAVKQ